jgi:hypothetical protein
MVHRAPEPTFIVPLEAQRTAKGAVHRAPWTNRCRAPCHVAHGKGQGQPCALTILCRAPCHVAHGKERVLPFPCVLGGARQIGCDAVSPRTAVNTFSLSCVTYYAWQRIVSCVAFFQSARQISLPGKNESGALCRALGSNVHGKGGVVRILPFTVRPRHTAKTAIPVVRRVRAHGHSNTTI